VSTEPSLAGKPAAVAQAPSSWRFTDLTFPLDPIDDLDVTAVTPNLRVRLLEHHGPKEGTELVATQGFGVYLLLVLLVDDDPGSFHEVSHEELSITRGFSRFSDVL